MLTIEEERFWEKVGIEENGCWQWIGAKNRKGYGFFFWKGKQRYAHRVVWDMRHGEFPPDNLTIDHLCGNPGCVNPEHLELVTIQENIRRAVHANRQKTHCKHGHPFDVENTIFHKSGQRVCRTCNNKYLRENWHKYSAGHKAAARKRREWSRQ